MESIAPVQQFASQAVRSTLGRGTDVDACVDAGRPGRSAAGAGRAAPPAGRRGAGLSGRLQFLLPPAGAMCCRTRPSPCSAICSHGCRSPLRAGCARGCSEHRLRAARRAACLCLPGGRRVRRLRGAPQRLRGLSLPEQAALRAVLPGSDGAGRHRGAAVAAGAWRWRSRTASAHALQAQG